jgi:3-hydroxyisobutyrate dehydrogenase-like beta-hydroxyacid dehydrogenase
MARRLAQAGFPVTVWNRSPDKASQLTQFGVRISDSPSSACAGADVVIVMLSNGPVVEEVLFSADRTGKKPAEAMAAGSVLVVMSSIPVETCQAQAPRLAARGVGYIDAPVSGGEPGARDGTLAIMAGGDANTIEGIADVFAAMGRVTHIGPVGTGQMTKVANQIIVGATVVGVAEALHFVTQGGADPAAVRKALMGGFADSKILNIHGERMVERNFVPGGPAEYELKDLRTAQALAAASGMHFTLLDCLVGMFGDMIDRFGTGLDVAGILQEVERRSGVAQPKKVSAEISP